MAESIPNRRVSRGFNPKPTSDAPPGSPRREINLRKNGIQRNWSQRVGQMGKAADGWAVDRPRSAAENIRDHARLAERVAVIYYRRHGLWPRLRRFLGGSL